ncbi:hypothetical protein [Klebsiella phage KpGranit]|uniref:Uncharacterized protein n=1 Tax=Klebsiella phage KpGranit TaxID=2596967 RepID=A0A5B8R483_9CAUD|nr:hypothetical protein [Klebsiella phage KpGranit]QEA03155.1 hypothetical protein [Klebsiella phage KpGranit]
MLQKFTPVANLPMVRGGARNLLDGSKCASIGHILGVYRSNMESITSRAFEHSRDYVLANPGAAVVIFHDDQYLVDNQMIDLIVSTTTDAYLYKASEGKQAAKRFCYHESELIAFTDARAWIKNLCDHLGLPPARISSEMMIFVLDKDGSILLPCDSYEIDIEEGERSGNYRYDGELPDEYADGANDIVTIPLETEFNTNTHTIDPNTGALQMNTIKSTATAIVAANKNAAVNAAKLEAGSIVLKKVSGIAASKAPFMVRGYVDTAVGRVVIANLLNFAVSQYAPNNRKAVIAADAAMQAAMLELVQSFNVGEMIDEVLKGVNLSSLIENDVAE